MINLDTIKQEAAGCTRCPLHKNRLNSVFEDGVRHAHTMLIGEAPGREENKQGKPFVGESGKLLNALIGFTLLHRDRHLYIANMVKCWPGEGNPNPPEEALTACAHFLDKQIQAVNPDIIVLIGSIAWKAFTDSSVGITKARGQWYNYEGYLVRPVLHPSYILRSLGPYKSRTEEEYRAIAEAAAPDSLINQTRYDFVEIEHKRSQLAASRMIFTGAK